MKCKIKHHNDSHFPGTVSQSVLLAQYSIHLACQIKPQRRNVVLHFSSHELQMVPWPTGLAEIEVSKLFFPQCLTLVPQSKLLLGWHTLPIIKDVMQVLAFSELHLFSKGISSRHITGLITLAFAVRTKALPDPQWALWGVLWAGGVARVTGMVAGRRKLRVRCCIPTGARQRL